ncbi:gamma-D-glutamyl-L-diamino acid endopeptidase I [Lachnospiraceae bacterium KM106-2]|nr:gamma-D-glutamyl-L-diamino acid endopeptidase I [Lachnospiraceae bacterium KM106-2]
MSYITLNQWYYYDDLISDCKRLKERYGDLLEFSVVGTSHDHRDIVMLTIGKGTKNVILTAGVHARETTNPVVLMKMVESYLEAMTKKQPTHDSIKIVKYLDEYSLTVLPLVNPDGYMIALRGFNIIRNDEIRLHCKSLNIPYQEWKYNGRGVDLNRNFPSVLWKECFPGDRAGSENETKALMQVFHSIPSEAFLDFHSRGRMIYYYREQLSDEYNSHQHEIAVRLAKKSGYVIVQPDKEVEDGDSGGNTVHYYSEQIKKPALTLETVYEYAKFPLDLKNQRKTFDEIYWLPFLCLDDKEE